VARATLNVSRTRLRAPFPAVVVSESADPGQFLGPGAGVAVLAGTDAAWVTVAVPLDRVSSLEIPGVEGHTGAGSAATVTQSLADGRQIARDGRVIGLGGQLDPATRTAQVLVEIARPLDPPDGGMPLLFGAFVDVALQGREAPGTIAVARSLLRDGNTVWVAAADDTLQPRRVQVGAGDDRTVLLRSGLQEGDRVVTSALSLPIAGARVALKGAPTADAADAADAPAQE
jgi:multidrug efflux pump subunit AcrA (membrane-fusion protein)